MNLKGKTALVTGAARRIGSSIAKTLAQNGADVVLHYNNSRKEAESLSEEIHKSGRKCWLTKHDLTDSDSTEFWFRKLLVEVKNLDILVNSASEFPEGNYRTMDSAELNRSMNLHVQSPLVMIRIMSESNQNGSVVNILDTRIADRDPSHAAYHMAKRGLFTLTRDLAVEMAPRLRINGVAPGVILPPDGKDESWIEKLKSTNPLQDRGTADDVTDAVMYLIKADFVTGQVIYVDGGRHLEGNVYGL
jgi:pteridine reductase